MATKKKAAKKTEKKAPQLPRIALQCESAKQYAGWVALAKASGLTLSAWVRTILERHGAKVTVKKAAPAKKKAAPKKAAPTRKDGPKPKAKRKAKVPDATADAVLIDELPDATDAAELVKRPYKAPAVKSGKHTTASRKAFTASNTPPPGEAAPAA